MIAVGLLLAFGIIIILAIFFYFAMDFGTSIGSENLPDPTIPHAHP